MIKAISFSWNSKICSYPVKNFYIIEIILQGQSTDFLYLSYAFWYKKSEISSDFAEKLCDPGKAKIS